MAELWAEALLAVEGGLRRDKDWEGKGEHGSCHGKASCPREIRRWGQRGGRGGGTERSVATRCREGAARGDRSSRSARKTCSVQPPPNPAGPRPPLATRPR